MKPYLIAIGKDRILIDVVDQILKGRPDAKADTKCQKVRCNDGIDDECACPTANPSACMHGMDACCIHLGDVPEFHEKSQYIADAAPCAQ